MKLPSFLDQTRTDKLGRQLKLPTTQYLPRLSGLVGEAVLTAAPLLITLALAGLIYLLA